MDFFRLAFAFVLVFGLLAWVAYRARRSQRPAPSAWSAWSLFFNQIPSLRGKLSASPELVSGSVRVLQKTRLTVQHELHLITTSSETLLVCTHPQGCDVLQRLKRDSAEFEAEVRAACR